MSIFKSSELVSWNPVLSASGLMTIAAQTNEFCICHILDSIGTFRFRFIFTTAGIADLSIYIPPPAGITFKNIGNNDLFVATMADGGGGDVARGGIDVTNNRFFINKFNNVPWGIGANKIIIGQGTFIADT